MNAVEFTKWMAEQDITGADEKAVYYRLCYGFTKQKRLQMLLEVSDVRVL